MLACSAFLSQNFHQPIHTALRHSAGFKKRPVAPFMHIKNWEHFECLYTVCVCESERCFLSFGLEKTYWQHGNKCMVHQDHILTRFDCWSQYAYIASLIFISLVCLEMLNKHFRMFYNHRQLLTLRPANSEWIKKIYWP